MWRNRLILLVLIISSGILVGIHGGAAAYLLFYTMLLLPVFSFIYVIYVYFRFRIYQKLEHRTVVKGERIPYTFRLANEDNIPYFNVSVEFMKDHSTVDHIRMAEHYFLAPGEEVSSSTFLTCHYRGEYFVGISHAKVTDYLSLFSITYPILTKIEMKVYPRLLDMKEFAYDPIHMDEKDRRTQKSSRQEILDTEIRKYADGDSLKMIHWKASAASGRLLSRTYTEESRNVVCLLADFYKIDCRPEERLLLEDKILEALLAVSKYFWRTRTNVRLFYGMEDVTVMDINTYADVQALYSFCCEMKYQSALPFNELVRTSAAWMPASAHMMLFTTQLSRELFEQIKKQQGNSVTATVFYMKHTQKKKDTLEEIFAHDFCLVPIPLDQEPVPVLEGRKNE